MIVILITSKKNSPRESSLPGLADAQSIDQGGGADSMRWDLLTASLALLSSYSEEALIRDSCLMPWQDRSGWLAKQFPSA